MVQQFSAALGKELKSALETGGPVAALEVCNLKAPGVAEQAGRTALKLRNAKNAPDDWEKSVLTRSEEGRRCRDTFLSLKKTCQKNAISFWAYLG